MKSPILKKIKDLRLKNDLSQKDMAKVLGYASPKGYHDVETGKIRLKVEQLQEIAKALNVPIETFF